MGAGRLELEEAMSDKNDWKPEKLLAGGQEREELGRAGEAESTLQKEGKEEDDQEKPGGVESDGEEQRGLNGVWPGRFQHEVAKMAEDLQSEPDRQLTGGATMEGDQQEEPDVEPGEEGVQPAVPDNAECRGDQQEGPEGEAEVGRSPQWEPEEMVTLEVQKEDPKEVAKEGDDQQRGLEEAEMEEPQPRELEIFERNEETQQEEEEGDEQEEPGRAESDMEEQRGLNGAAWPGRFQHEMAKMAEDLRSEPGGQLVGGATMEGNQQEEPDIEPGEEGVQPVVPDSAECRGDQQEGPEGEAEVGRSPRWEPEEMVKVQEEDPKEVTKTGDGQPRGQEEAEMEEPQPREPEIFERNEETQQQEEEGDEQEEPSRAESDKEEQRGLNGATWPGRFQHEVAKMAEDLRSEPGGQLVRGANMEGDQQEEPDIEAGDERVQPESAESGGEEQGGPEGEAETGSNSQWEPEQEAAGGEEQRGDGTAWAGRSEQEVAMMVEDQSLEAEGPLEGGSEAEHFRQREPDVKTGDERAHQTMLGGVEIRGDQQGGQEVKAEKGRNLQWEPEETVTLEEHLESQQQGLEGAEKGEGHQCRKPEGLVRNEAKTEEEEEQEVQMGEAELEKDQKTDPEALVGIVVLEEVVGAEAVEEPEVQGQEPKETGQIERNLPHEPLGYKAAADTCCFAGAGLSPDKVSLDMTAQKERVLLNRKSSVRRAPSLKRPRPPMETSPQQETSTEANSPPPPPTHPRPNLRHAGFGPMHPNMMAELQTRLRRPQ
uniref:Uncharacterized protein n=2 Tax=Sphaerodactylus townsendi TaxID=933632 RepID=A0ACB8EW65_9SAUR